MNRFNSFRTISRKVCFSLGILLIYILGRNIPLPFVGASSAQGGTYTDFLSYAMLVSGGDGAARSLFTLGIGPYMSTMMIWRFISMSDWFKRQKLSQDQAGRLQNLLTLMIGLIQALGLVATYRFHSLSGMGLVDSPLAMRAILVLLLLAGSFFMIWLGSQNSKHGLGQYTIFICVGIISRYVFSPQLYQRYFSQVALTQEKWLFSLLIGVAVVALIGTILLELAELRLPLNRVMIDSRYNEDNYLPIKLNPSGGMSIMYAMTFLALPQYLLRALSLVVGESQTLESLMNSMSLTAWPGSILYVTTVFLLSILMAFVNVNPSEVSDQLKRSGDYILGIRPGRPTEVYLSRKILKVSFIGGSFLTLVAGAPMLWAVELPQYQQLLQLPGSVSILAGLMTGMVLEMRAYYIKGQYGPLLSSVRVGA